MLEERANAEEREDNPKPGSEPGCPGCKKGKTVDKYAGMSEEMQQDAVDIASQALAKYNIEKVRRFLFFMTTLLQ